MGAKSRRKGARGELEAAEVMRDLWPNVRRRAMQSRGGHEGADLDNTPGYHVEVGCGNVNPRAKWEQAYTDSLDHPSESRGYGFDTPIALTRKDRGEWIVTMSAVDFKALVRKATPCPDCEPCLAHIKVVSDPSEPKRNDGLRVAKIKATSHGEGKSEREPEAQGDALRCKACLLAHRAGEGCGDAVQRAIRGEQAGDQ